MFSLLWVRVRWSWVRLVMLAESSIIEMSPASSIMIIVGDINGDNFWSEQGSSGLEIAVESECCT